MSEKILSVFIDESGDFGPFAPHSPYYIVTMVLHDQDNDISANIRHFEMHLQNLGYSHHAVHTGPLIRRESVYSNDHIGIRKSLFNALFHFSRKIDIHYICIKIKKSECQNGKKMDSKLSNEISKILYKNASFLNSFNRIIIYYDNGQIELSRIITDSFHSIYPHIEFRKVSPSDYKLFQTADLICTLELLAEKAQTNSFSRSEIDFFESIRDFRRNYLKYILKKRL